MLNENRVRILYGITNLILNSFFTMASFLHITTYQSQSVFWNIIGLIIFVTWVLHCYAFGIRWVIKSNKEKLKHWQRMYEEWAKSNPNYTEQDYEMWFKSNHPNLFSDADEGIENLKKNL